MSQQQQQIYILEFNSIESLVSCAREWNRASTRDRGDRLRTAVSAWNFCCRVMQHRPSLPSKEASELAFATHIFLRELLPAMRWLTLEATKRELDGRNPSLEQNEKQSEVSAQFQSDSDNNNNNNTNPLISPASIVAATNPQVSSILSLNLENLKNLELLEFRQVHFSIPTIEEQRFDFIVRNCHRMPRACRKLWFLNCVFPDFVANNNINNNSSPTSFSSAANASSSPSRQKNEIQEENDALDTIFGSNNSNNKNKNNFNKTKEKEIAHSGLGDLLLKGIAAAKTSPLHPYVLLGYYGSSLRSLRIVGSETSLRSMLRAPHLACVSLHLHELEIASVFTKNEEEELRKLKAEMKIREKMERQQEQRKQQEKESIEGNNNNDNENESSEDEEEDPFSFEDDLEPIEVPFARAGTLSQSVQLDFLRRGAPPRPTNYSNSNNFNNNFNNLPKSASETSVSSSSAASSSPFQGIAGSPVSVEPPSSFPSVDSMSNLPSPSSSKNNDNSPSTFKEQKQKENDDDNTNDDNNNNDEEDNALRVKPSTSTFLNSNSIGLGSSIPSLKLKFTMWPALSRLVLRGLRWKQIHRALSALPALTNLDLSRNHITSLLEPFPVLAQNNNLEVINLSWNRLRFVGSCHDAGLPSSVISVDLSHNLLESFNHGQPLGLPNCCHLEELNVSYNKMAFWSDIHALLHKTWTLRKFTCNRNPFVDVSRSQEEADKLNSKKEQQQQQQQKKNSPSKRRKKKTLFFYPNIRFFPEDFSLLCLAYCDPEVPFLETNEKLVKRNSADFDRARKLANWHEPILYSLPPIAAQDEHNNFNNNNNDDNDNDSDNLLSIDHVLDVASSSHNHHHHPGEKHSSSATSSSITHSFTSADHHHHVVVKKIIRKKHHHSHSHSHHPHLSQEEFEKKQHEKEEREKLHQQQLLERRKKISELFSHLSPEIHSFILRFSDSLLKPTSSSSSSNTTNPNLIRKKFEDEEENDEEEQIPEMFAHPPRDVHSGSLMLELLYPRNNENSENENHHESKKSSSKQNRHDHTTSYVPEFTHLFALCVTEGTQQWHCCLMRRSLSDCIPTDRNEALDQCLLPGATAILNQKDFSSSSSTTNKNEKSSSTTNKNEKNKNNWQEVSNFVVSDCIANGGFVQSIFIDSDLHNHIHHPHHEKHHHHQQNDKKKSEKREKEDEKEEDEEEEEHVKKEQEQEFKSSQVHLTAYHVACYVVCCGDDEQIQTVENFLKMELRRACCSSSSSSQNQNNNNNNMTNNFASNSDSETLSALVDLTSPTTKTSSSSSMIPISCYAAGRRPWIIRVVAEIFHSGAIDGFSEFFDSQQNNNNNSQKQKQISSSSSTTPNSFTPFKYVEFSPIINNKTSKKKQQQQHLSQEKEKQEHHHQHHHQNHNDNNEHNQQQHRKHYTTFDKLMSTHLPVDDSGLAIPGLVHTLYDHSVIAHVSCVCSKYEHEIFGAKSKTTTTKHDHGDEKRKQEQQQEQKQHEKTIPSTIDPKKLHSYHCFCEFSAERILRLVPLHYHVLKKYRHDIKTPEESWLCEEESCCSRHLFSHCCREGEDDDDNNSENSSSSPASTSQNNFLSAALRSATHHHSQHHHTTSASSALSSGTASSPWWSSDIRNTLSHITVSADFSSFTLHAIHLGSEVVHGPRTLSLRTGNITATVTLLWQLRNSLHPVKLNICIEPVEIFADRFLNNNNNNNFSENVSENSSSNSNKKEKTTANDYEDDENDKKVPVLIGESLENENLSRNWNLILESKQEQQKSNNNNLSPSSLLQHIESCALSIVEPSWIGDDDNNNNSSENAMNSHANITSALSLLADQDNNMDNNNNTSSTSQKQKQKQEELPEDEEHSGIFSKIAQSSRWFLGTVTGGIIGGDHHHDENSASSSKKKEIPEIESQPLWLPYDAPGSKSKMHFGSGWFLELDLNVAKNNKSTSSDSSVFAFAAERSSSSSSEECDDSEHKKGEIVAMFMPEDISIVEVMSSRVPNDSTLSTSKNDSASNYVPLVFILSLRCCSCSSSTSQNKNNMSFASNSSSSSSSYEMLICVAAQQRSPFLRMIHKIAPSTSPPYHHHGLRGKNNNVAAAAAAAHSNSGQDLFSFDHDQEQKQEDSEETKNNINKKSAAAPSSPRRMVKNKSEEKMKMNSTNILPVVSWRNRI